MIRRDDVRTRSRAAAALLVMVALLGAMFVITSGSVFAQSPSASAAASGAVGGATSSGSPAASGGVTAASSSPTAPATSTVPGSQTGGSAPILPILALLAIVAAGALVITPQHLANRQRR